MRSLSYSYSLLWNKYGNQVCQLVKVWNVSRLSANRWVAWMPNKRLQKIWKKSLQNSKVWTARIWEAVLLKMTMFQSNNCSYIFDWITFQQTGLFLKWTHRSCGHQAFGSLHLICNNMPLQKHPFVTQAVQNRIKQVVALLETRHKGQSILQTTSSFI